MLTRWRQVFLFLLLLLCFPIDAHGMTDFSCMVRSFLACMFFDHQGVSCRVEVCSVTDIIFWTKTNILILYASALCTLFCQTTPVTYDYMKRIEVKSLLFWVLQEISAPWDIQATPTFIFLKHGQQLDKPVGSNTVELEKKSNNL